MLPLVFGLLLSTFICAIAGWDHPMRMSHKMAKVLCFASIPACIVAGVTRAEGVVGSLMQLGFILACVLLLALFFKLRSQVA